MTNGVVLKVNYLETLRLLSFGIWYDWRVKILLKLLIIYDSVLLVIQVAYLQANFSKRMLGNYLPVVFGTVFILTMVVILLICETILTKILQGIMDHSRPLDRNSITAIQAKEKYIISTLVTSIFFTATIFLTLSPFTGDSLELFLIYRICDEYLGSNLMCLLIKLGYWLSFAVVACGSGSLALIGLYFALHMSAQISLIHLQLEDLSKRFSQEDEEELITSRQYQEEIYQKLCSIVHRQITIKKLVEQTFSTLSKFFVVVVIAGALCLMAIIMYLINQLSSNNSQIAFLRVTFGTIAGLLFNLLFWGCGQLLQDETENYFSAAANCPWPLWNVKNRKCLLIFMQNVRLPMTFVIGNILEISYATFVKFFKVMYSFATVLMQLN